MSSVESALGRAERVAESVLYEGYLLYPYRLSAVKNRRRWTFGMLFPRTYCESHDRTESWRLHAEILAERGTKVCVKVRFLQTEGSNVQKREVVLADLAMTDLVRSRHTREFDVSPVLGKVELEAEEVGNGFIKVRLELSNLSLCEGQNRETALPSALIGAHAIASIEGGMFLSLTDPPEEARATISKLGRGGLWPVLVGGRRRASTILAAPIILEDDPQIAPQSHGDLFDCTEIEEVLRLRMLTMTDAEKEEMRRSDERGRNILEKNENLGADELLRLHGSLVPTPGAIRPGARVRVRPKRRADIMDTVLADRTATVIAVEQDFEDQLHLAVVFDEDPGREWGLEGRGGHRFFYFEDEVELL